MTTPSSEAEVAAPVSCEVSADGANSPMEFAEPRAAYIHVPFCAHRCGYCDFTLVAGKDHLIDDYLRALEMELQTLVEPRSVDTLFFGGGTPTHLSPRQLDRLLRLVLNWFTLADGYEFSVEANPADLDDDKVQILADAGVNRVSLGSQSFDADVLKLLERDHRAADIVSTIERLRPRINNFSLDLIFGVPGQSLELWRATLQQAVALGPKHISTYGLTIEKGTAFWTRRRKGELIPVPDELERDMYAAAMDDLPAAGFEQYEISNFAQPGYQCRHNDVYWRAESYYAFGPGAARYINGRRETNHRSVTAWIKRVLANESPVGDSEQLDPEARARESIALALRRTDGLNRNQFQQRTGYELNNLAAAVIEKHVSGGLMEDNGSDIRLTREGRFLADMVVADFL